MAKEIRILLDEPMRQQVAKGQHNFVAQIIAAVQSRGWRVCIKPDTRTNRLMSRLGGGPSLFHMTHPGLAQGLTFRRAYVYPFWTIERTGTRWNFSIAERRFSPKAIDHVAAKDFCDRTRTRLFGARTGAARDARTIYVLLQGQILRRRSHQAQSPADMVKTTCSAFPNDPIVVTLHPKEQYTAREIAALQASTAGHSGAEIARKSPHEVLPHAKLIVTQNSSVAFEGLFYHKPVVLFARSDFHHIAYNVAQSDPQLAFERALGDTAHFDAYLYWFLQKNALNAGRADIQTRILSRLRDLGWDV